MLMIFMENLPEGCSSGGNSYPFTLYCLSPKGLQVLRPFPKANFKSKVRTANVKSRDFIARDKRICNARAELSDIGDLIFFRQLKTISSVVRV